MHFKTCLLLVLSLLAACRGSARAPEHELSKDSIPSKIDTILAVTFQGDGFTLTIPLDATTAPSREHVWDLPGTEILGPLARRNDGFISNAYILVASVFQNPQRLTLDAWVDSMRSRRNAHEFDPDSLSFLHPPDTVDINGVRALRFDPWCGDCQPHEYYVGRDDAIVALSYVESGLESWPRGRHVWMCERIIRTFEWDR